MICTILNCIKYNFENYIGSITNIQNTSDEEYEFILGIKFNLEHV